MEKTSKVKHVSAIIDYFDDLISTQPAIALAA